MTTGMGTPSRVAGLNLNLSAAAWAASSKPLPTGVGTSALVTDPSRSTVSLSTTSACSPAFSASGGYSACSKWVSSGKTMTGFLGGSLVGAGGLTTAPEMPLGTAP